MACGGRCVWGGLATSSFFSSYHYIYGLNSGPWRSRKVEDVGITKHLQPILSRFLFMFTFILSFSLLRFSFLVSISCCLARMKSPVFRGSFVLESIGWAEAISRIIL